MDNDLVGGEREGRDGQWLVRKGEGGERWTMTW